MLAGTIQFWDQDASMQIILWNDRTERLILSRGFDVQLELPSVQDRVEQLSKVLPKEHALYKLVKDLEHVLQSEQNELSFMRRWKENSNGISRPGWIDILHKILLPFKLHAEILRNALFTETSDCKGTSLHQYIGDVLCVTFLLRDDGLDCSFAEGSLSQMSVENEIRIRPSRYRSWIMMHSGILRTKRFTNTQQNLLRIPDFYGEAVEEENYMRSPSTWRLSMDCYKNDAFMQSQMTLVYDNFGPLGPTFRGRDVVTMREITAHHMVAYFSSFSPAFQSEAANSAFTWLCLAHEQAFVSRPMTVRDPIIYLR
jgi:hypothetical protein